MSEPVVLLLIVVKALFVVLYSLTLAIVLTWADRRQGAMIQDRVGPNRAVIFLPGSWAALLTLGLGVAVGGLVIHWASSVDAKGPGRTVSALCFSQLAILVTWVFLLAIAGRVRKRGARSTFDLAIAALGDPRRIAIAGLGAHGLSVLAALSLRGTEQGLLLREIGLRSGPAIFAFSTVGAALYAAVALAKVDRVGIRLAGLLHSAADGLKTAFKEDIIPPGVDRFVHSIAPFISFFPVLALLAVVPFGDSLCLGPGADGSTLLVPGTATCQGASVPFQVLRIDSGLLYYFALAGTGIVGAALAGWASNNKYSLLGGLRAASQMISYEVTLGLTLVGTLMIYGTLRIEDMVAWQGQHAWGIFVQPLGFLLFFAAAVAESKRVPFDLPEGESEIVAGYFTEYSGMKFAMFFFAEYVVVVTSSALMVALFFGGWQLPFLDRQGIHIAIGENVVLDQALPHLLVVLGGFVGFLVKVAALCWFQLLVRWTLPRFRYDQLMNLGWRKLLPASLLNVLLTGLLLLVVDSLSPEAQAGLQALGDLTQLVLAVSGAVALILLVRFLLSRPTRQRLLSTSSARLAQAMGGTRTIRMGA